MSLRVTISVLALFVMASALYLVNTRYQSRSLFIQSEHLQLQGQELDIAWRHLQSDRAELARHARVDQMARNELNLSSADLNRTLYIQGKPSALPPRARRP